MAVLETECRLSSLMPHTLCMVIDLSATSPHSVYTAQSYVLQAGSECTIVSIRVHLLSILLVPLPFTSHGTLLSRARINPAIA